MRIAALQESDREGSVAAQKQKKGLFIPRREEEAYQRTGEPFYYWKKIAPSFGNVKRFSATPTMFVT
jgi:hypothetical protein